MRLGCREEGDMYAVINEATSSPLVVSLHWGLDEALEAWKRRNPSQEGRGLIPVKGKSDRVVTLLRAARVGDCIEQDDYVGASRRVVEDDGDDEG